MDFATLLAESDFITVHCPRNHETVGMFGAEAFAAMDSSETPGTRASVDSGEIKVERAP